MEQKASEIQKQRIKEIESAADRLVGKCKIMSVSYTHLTLPTTSRV